MLYAEVFKALNKEGVKYAVVGGMAVVLYGYVRFTADLDLIVCLDEKNVDKFFGTLTKLGYLPKVPVTKEQFKDKKQRSLWRKEKGMIVFSFFHPKEHLKLIDVFIDEPIKFDIIKKSLKKIKVAGITIPLLSLKHLIKLKEKAGRAKDLIDLANLKAITKLSKNEK
ncbi:MAG: hypothetical protein AB1629_02145 [Candidatus Omnitrophota bacterium]